MIEPITMPSKSSPSEPFKQTKPTLSGGGLSGLRSNAQRRFPLCASFMVSIHRDSQPLGKSFRPGGLSGGKTVNHIFIRMAPSSHRKRYGHYPVTGWFLFLAIGFSLLGTSSVIWNMASPVNLVARTRSPVNVAANATTSVLESRAIVMCAYNAETLRMAWAQIRSIQHIHGASNEIFIVYNAGELNTSDHDTKKAIERVQTLPNARIESLSAWYESAYGNDRATEGLENFQGFICKVGALLAAPYDIVALIDTDVILMNHPFTLIKTPSFQTHGNYLFRDRRISGREGPQGTEAAYRTRLRELWQEVRAEDDQEFPSALSSSPPFTGWSYEYGESAVVLMNKQRHAKAMGILQLMVGPRLFEQTTAHIFGDKEVYWQALAFANETPGMNAYANADVGLANERKDACCHKYTNAQWVWFESDRPKIFYINGDGVEDWMTGKDDTLLNSFVSDPLYYFSPNTRVDYLASGCCNKGANSMPSYAREIMHGYRLHYELYDQIESTEKISEYRSNTQR